MLAGIRREGRGQGRGQTKGLHWSAADTVAGADRSPGCATRRVWRSRPIVPCACPKPSPSRSRTSQQNRMGRATSLSVARKQTRKAGARCSMSASPPCARSRQVERPGPSMTAHCFTASVAATGCRPPGSRIARHGRSFRRMPPPGSRGACPATACGLGAAQSPANAGAGLVELQQVVRWESPSMLTHCARGQLAAPAAARRPGLTASTRATASKASTTPLRDPAAAWGGGRPRHRWAPPMLQVASHDSAVFSPPEVQKATVLPRVAGQSLGVISVPSAIPPHAPCATPAQ